MMVTGAAGMRTARWLLSIAVVIATARADQREYFETKIRPLLAEKCFACHTASRMGGLEMKSREALLRFRCCLGHFVSVSFRNGLAWLLRKPYSGV